MSKWGSVENVCSFLALTHLFLFYSYPSKITKSCAFDHLQLLPILLLWSRWMMSGRHVFARWSHHAWHAFWLIGFCQAPPQLGDLQRAQVTCCNKVCVWHKANVHIQNTHTHTHTHTLAHTHAHMHTLYYIMLYICVGSWLPSRRAGLVWSRCLSPQHVFNPSVWPSCPLYLPDWFVRLRGHGVGCEFVRVRVSMCVCATSYEHVIQSTETPEHTHTHTHKPGLWCEMRGSRDASRSGA